jgi:NAD(P)H-nitrite reductase large subunit
MKIVIIGQSPAAVAAIKTLRQDNGDFDITLISTDGNLPYDRFLFPRLITQKGKETGIFCETAEFYQSLRVEIVCNKEFSRINFTRRKVFLADKLQIEYDCLILADAPQPRLPDRKGIRKPGVFTLARIEAMRNLVRYLPFTETALIEACGWTGIETALALKAAGKDVVVVSGKETLLPGVLPQEMSALLLALLDKRGVRVLFNTRVEDVLGEGECKAVRLSSGKVLAAEMFIIEDIRPDLRFLEGADIVLSEGIVVTGTMQTSVQSAYAVDVMAQLQEPLLVGSYALSTGIGAAQAVAAVSSIKGVATTFTLDPLDPRSRLEAVFSSAEVTQAEGSLPPAEIVVCDPAATPEG